MDEVDLLYQEMILDHNKNPRNFGELEDATHKAVGHNPLCGDHIEIFLKVKDGKVEDVKFKGVGCAISKASASIMTTVLKGKTLDEVKNLFEKFHNVLTSKPDEPVNTEELGKLAVFAGVREFPVRVKCATLAWHTLIEAIEKKDSVLTVE
ncbi:SUF system NifU family Fe-S cluster assembly protein [Bacteroidetes/Chlorobi group bacterium MS-B_bin-24]|jgi:nitrogen fixation NifU-like protein|nr:MAG: SUF system NifU family Fe-S cluster assembly protein [Bacteroidetes/Chlorobi group bacterium MS-B_bin-24]